ncbi:hypothetical protein [Streptomyces sp. NPDC016626]|uniref:hypothetical protein n=1 Tax=Streptomyces sp. NPDC016626 TaxID=3364968 RepID=UPI0036FD0204
MAQSSWPDPANGRAVTDIQHEQLAARFSDDGVYGDPGDAAVVTAGTGLTVDIRAGVHGSLRGHGWTSGESTVSLEIAANTTSTIRRDRVVLRLDRADWTVRAVVKTGAGFPPALTQDTGVTGVYEIPLATLTVPLGASSVSVTRGELYVGTRVRPCTSTTRNPAPRRTEMAVETDTGRVIMWTGSAWTVVSDDSGEINVGSPVSAWSSNAEHILEKKNGSVHLRLGSWTREAGDLSATTESRLPVLIPAAYRHPTRDQYGLGYITGGEQIARFIIYSASSDRAGQVWLTNKPTIAKGESVLPVSGISWVVN